MEKSARCHLLCIKRTRLVTLFHQLNHHRKCRCCMCTVFLAEDFPLFHSEPSMCQIHVKFPCPAAHPPSGPRPNPRRPRSSSCTSWPGDVGRTGDAPRSKKIFRATEYNSYPQVSSNMAGKWTIETDSCPIKTSIHGEFSIAMFDCQRAGDATRCSK